MKIMGVDLDFYRKERRAKKQGRLAILLDRAGILSRDRKPTKGYAGIRHEDEHIARFTGGMKREKRLRMLRRAK